MSRLAALMLALCLAALPLRAEEIVADLSQSDVSITASFEGSEILVFGAVRREAPLPDTRLGVIITVEGPSEPVVVRRKDRVAGIWINTDALTIDQAPTFYAIASSAPLSEVLTETEDLRHRISIDQAVRTIGATEEVSDAVPFNEALVRIRETSGSYQLKETGVRLASETLFDTRIALPANLTEGGYRTRIFLTRDGAVVDLFETEIAVRKVGLERFIYRLAHDQPFAYGLLALAIAIAAGWGASAFFRWVRG